MDGQTDGRQTDALRLHISPEYPSAFWWADDIEVYDRMQKLSACGYVHP